MYNRASVSRYRRLFPRSLSTLLVVAAGFLGVPPAWSQAPPDYAAAASYVKAGEFDLAIPLLEKFLAATPGDLKARNLLGIALLNAGRKEEASVQCC